MSNDIIKPYIRTNMINIVYTTGEARTAVFNDLKAKLQEQKQTLFRPTTAQTSSLMASYSVSFELAKSKKPLSDGEIVKRCGIQMALAFGED